MNKLAVTKIVTKKLLVVGSDDLELNRIEKFLNNWGLPSAQNLTKEKIKATEISQILLKAHNVKSDNKYMQLRVNQVWNGLAMDLMMSNIDQKLWVWKDKEAISFLDYWKSLDSTLSFVLVYNAPNKLFEKLLQQETMPSMEELEEELKIWKAYNRELLNFYYRNQDRCILVNSEQIIDESPIKFLEIGKEIGIEMESKNFSLEAIHKNFNKSEIDDQLYVNLINTLIQNYPDVLALYDELQSSANLPYQQIYKKNISVYDSITSYVKTQKALQEKDQQLEKQLENGKQFQERLKELENKKDFQAEENEMLLAQLHSVQEELEKRYIETQKTEKTLKAREQALQEKDQQLEKQLENGKQFQERLKELENKKDFQAEENEMLLAQLHSVQEELERQYLKNIEQQKKKESQRFYGAADRIKQQLSYRLGAKMIENSKSLGGIILMPFSLYGEVKKYRKEQKTRKKLPSIYKYADVYEAERVKKHLSYRLGSAMVESMKSPFGVFKLPFALKTAHKEYKEEKNNVSK
jgi:hypothetical protein